MIVFEVILAVVFAFTFAAAAWWGWMVWAYCLAPAPSIRAREARMLDRIVERLPPVERHYERRSQQRRQALAAWDRDYRELCTPCGASAC